jgi:hypothetical protein
MVLPKSNCAIFAKEKLLGFSFALVVAAVNSPLVYGTTAQSGELNACTFYRDLDTRFWGCAEPKIHRKSCTITRGACPACVRYPGERGEMWLPDFFIEVTTRYGESRFADEMPVPFKPHLEIAKRWAESRAGGFPSSKFTDSSSANIGSAKQHFWHARMLLPPFGGLVFQYADLPIKGVATAAAPTCFSAISEQLFDQWHLGLADSKYALLWAPIGLVKCMDPAAIIADTAINATIGQLKGAGFSEAAGGGTIGEKFGPLGCSYGVPGPLMSVANAKPGSDATSFSKLCMGSLGNLLPREGAIENDDPFRSALMAAWKFASLTKDALPASLGGIQSDDKWQLVYPKNLDFGCFRPQNAFIGDWLPPGPQELRDFTEEGQTYIFAIWRSRKTKTCYELGTADLRWKKPVQLVNYYANKGVCGL